MTMANYKLNLRLNEQQINILYDALQYYSTMSESMVDNYTSQDVDALFEEVSNLYLEEEPEHQMDPAAKAFIEQYGSDELLGNYERWKGFKAAYDLIHESKPGCIYSDMQLDDPEDPYCYISSVLTKSMTDGERELVKKRKKKVSIRIFEK